MTQYRINDLERLTGVKAHTIRIWEKRYMLIEPSRTSTNRRFYSDTQLLKLLNVSTLLAHGYKISNVATLSDDALNNLIEQLHSAPSNDTICAAYIHDLFAAMVAFNEAEFESVFDTAVHKLGLHYSMINVFYPFLHKTGLLWRTEKAMPIQEHFASCIIRRKTISSVDGLPPAKPNAKKFVLFLPPAEWHELGLLFANYVIRSHGQKTIYLGQNVPYNDLSVVIDAIHPEYLLAFYIYPRPSEEVALEIEELVRMYPDAQLLLAGDSNLFAHVDFSHHNIHHLATIDSIMQFL